MGSRADLPLAAILLPAGGEDLLPHPQDLLGHEGLQALRSLGDGRPHGVIVATVLRDLDHVADKLGQLLVLVLVEPLFHRLQIWEQDTVHSMV